MGGYIGAYKNTEGIQAYRGHTDIRGMYGSMRNMQMYVWGMYRCMGPYRHMGDVWGIQMYRGCTDLLGYVQKYGEHKNVWGMYRCMGMYRCGGSYRHLPKYILHMPANYAWVLYFV